MEKFKNARRVATVALMVPVLVVMGALSASALPSDAATAVDGQFDALLADITGVYIPALLGLVVVGIGIRLGIKWLSRGASKA